MTATNVDRTRKKTAREPVKNTKLGRNKKEPTEISVHSTHTHTLKHTHNYTNGTEILPQNKIVPL